MKRRSTGASKSPASESALLQVCFEVLDRAAELETLLRSNTNPLLAEREGSASGDDFTKEEGFLRDWAKLRALRQELLNAELRVDASLSKMAALRASVAEQVGCLDGWFLRELDRAIEDFGNVSNPDTSAGVRDLATNYLIKEMKFPFEAIFDEGEVQRFFRRLRGEVDAVIRELTV